MFGKRRAYQRKVAVAEFEAVVSGDIYVLAPKDTQRLLRALEVVLATGRSLGQWWADEPAEGLVVRAQGAERLLAKVIAPSAGPLTRKPPH